MKRNINPSRPVCLSIRKEGHIGACYEMRDGEEICVLLHRGRQGSGSQREEGKEKREKHYQAINNLERSITGHS